MEIYEAIADFVPPVDQYSRNILAFSKGDTFEIFHSGRLTDWWGARALHSTVTGYVPAKYMKYVEKRVGELPDNYNEEKERKIKHFEDMQNSFYPNHPQNIEIPEPDPDYNEDEGDSFPPPPPPLSTDNPENNLNSLEEKLNGHMPPASVMRPPPVEDSIQIQPKKLGNPCAQSRERQALHKELLLNYKRGVNVLQKPELSKVLDKRKEVQRHKEWENEQSNKRTSLELKLEERANKMKEEESGRMKSISEKNENTPEFLKMHSKITQKSPNN